MHNIGWGCVEILPKIVWLCFRGVCTYVYSFIAHLLLFFSRHCRSIGFYEYLHFYCICRLFLEITLPTGNVSLLQQIPSLCNKVNLMRL